MRQSMGAVERGEIDQFEVGREGIYHSASVEDLRRYTVEFGCKLLRSYASHSKACNKCLEVLLIAY